MGKFGGGSSGGQAVFLTPHDGTYQNLGRHIHERVYYEALYNALERAKYVDSDSPYDVDITDRSSDFDTLKWIASTIRSDNGSRSLADLSDNSVEQALAELDDIGFLDYGEYGSDSGGTDEEKKMALSVANIVDRAAAKTTEHISDIANAMGPTLNAVDSYLQTYAAGLAGNAATEKISKVTPESIDAKVTKADTAADEHADDAFDSISANVRTAMDTLVTSSTAATKTDVTSVIEDFLTQFLGSTVSNLGDVVTQAISAANSAIGLAVIDSAVDNFEQKQMLPYMRGVNRFAGGMADVNAVNSSAFMVGMSNLEAEFQRSVGEFRGDLELRVFTSVIGQYLALFQQTLSTHMQGYLSELDTYLRAYTTILPQEVQVYLTVFTEYLKVYLQDELNYMDMYSKGVQSGTSVMQQRGDMERSTLTDLAKAEFGAYLQHKGLRDQGKVGYLTQAVSRYVANTWTKDHIQMQAINLSAELARLRFVSEKEYAEWTEESKRKEKLWPIEAWTRAANIIAAGSGGVVESHEQRPYSALGGALSGAVAGGFAAAQIPVIGQNPYAIGAGALIGAGIGAFS